MFRRDSGRRFRRIFVNTLASLIFVAVAIYLAWELRPLILPVILGILLAYLFRPLKTAFRYRWLPNGIRVAFLFLVLTGSLLSGHSLREGQHPQRQRETRNPRSTEI